MRIVRDAFLCAVLIGGGGVAWAKAPPESAKTTATAKPAATPAATPTSPAPAPPALDPSKGAEVGMVFESWLTPHQEGDEEENTPSSVPKQFRSQTPSMSRAAREAAGHRGHGQLRFSKDLSRAWVDVKIEGVNTAEINMFHIHCGKPGILGPILVDFAVATDLKSNIADGMFSVEIRNEHIVKTTEHGHGSVIGTFTMGCIIPSPSLSGAKPTKVLTVAGMAQLAQSGDLYFNLHTTGQTYYGDIRGQLHPADKTTR
ncbi:MAG: CHRD domain-containing protein [Myxococcaceae bacterium]|nr:CHRD domain-containing protein [Myxococcaceae bacterium]